ncbi:hypothetical protein TWF103_011047 [Orbilia oligospora]|nr:hypothetical protein TWF103_011047 [Orbilia oligospora]
MVFLWPFSKLSFSLYETTARKLRDFFASIKAPPLTTDQYKTITETTILTNPRNLQIDLDEWDDIKTSIKALLTPYLSRELPNLPPVQLKPRIVHSEQDKLSYALVAFEAPTEWILKAFGISSQFSSGKPILNIGSPGRVFRLTKQPNYQPNNPTPHIVRFFVEFKTSPVAAFTYLCHYTTTQEWFLRSPLADIHPSLKENQYLLDFDADMEFVNDDKPTLDRRDILLRREIRLSIQVASVMTGCVLDKTNATIKLQNIVLKIYDLSDPETARQSYRELNAYKECCMLQGKPIPIVYAIGTVWGLLRVFVMENCATAVKGEKFSRDNWEKANDVLEKLHGCGITHGDLKTDDFVVSEQGHMRLIDLGLAMKRPVQDGHFEDEKKDFEWLREDRGRR